MNKIAIKNFAVWARNKLIAEIVYKAGLLGITDKGIKAPLPQSTKNVQFFDIGAREPYSITDMEIEQRRNLTEVIQKKEKQTDYTTAYKSVVEEVAYTWFNRLIAVRFMEVNDYLPSRIRVLSSESSGKIEPDLVTSPFDADLDYESYEKDQIIQLKNDNKLNELFRMLFIKQCNVLNAILPELFEKTNDYTELLMNVSFTDKDGVVYHLVHDIPEEDFNVEKEGQVEIIGWLYQYYNTEPKDETFALLKKNVKITKERIPAATQLFTPDWLVRYMVENSLGRLWIERHPNDDLKSGWKYYLNEAEQEPQVQTQLNAIREEYKTIKPEDIKVIDPCMGSGHILVYAFDVLMQIYESYGYSQRDAAKSILENNLYGLDIDNRAYQLAYFAIMMKARQYNRRILDHKTYCNVYSIHESNGINSGQLKYFGQDMIEQQRNIALSQMEYLLDIMWDAKEYGSILNIENLNWDLLSQFTNNADNKGQMTLETIDLDITQKQLCQLVKIATCMARKYDVVVTNPPYMGSSGMGAKLSDFVKKNYPDSKSDLFAVLMERCGQMTKKYYYQAMITQHAWMFLSSFEKLRQRLLQLDTLNMAHLGARAFEEIAGEVVQTTAFVLRNSHVNDYKGTYARLVDYGSQHEKEKAFIKKQDLYTTAQESFSKIPGKPIAYWASEKVISIFSSSNNIRDYGEPRHGMSTGNNDKCLKLWFEVNFNKISFNSGNKKDFDQSGCKFIPYNKGGTFRKWYGNNDYVIAYDKPSLIYMTNLPGYRSSSVEYFFRPSINWSDVSTSYFGARYSFQGFAFDGRGASMFCKDENERYLLAVLCSKFANNILKVLNPTLTFNIENVASIPVIIDNNYIDQVEKIVQQNIIISKTDWDSYEFSWDFLGHPFIIYKSGSNHLADIFILWEQFASNQFNQLKNNEVELNRILINIYDLQHELTPDVEDKDITIRKADLGRDVRSFISYVVGCIFGRYSLDVKGLAYAGDNWERSKYITFIPDKNNIIPITDEEYFEDDLVGLFCIYLKESFGEDALEENLDFIAKALGNKGNSSREVIRNYFLKDFFKDHCKLYQKRPIYWLFDSGKADGFKGLVYMHRYNEDTIGNLRIDYLHQMQRVYDGEIARMQETINNSNNAREVATATKRKEKLTKQLKETKEYDEKIAHLALARISIDLDDGVKVNYDKVQTGTDGIKLDVLAKI
ncbi:BREX-1 system adenine-specific DNA-methyltransferase PglX [Paenibacillus sp. N4]|uniref:BREX-1 system adenine-specific DNA-methyltransferase PglX n=1 Tax=Paenibacillus vietnamensis TaxID=2590547 RepID=UPI001CD0A252|nr:BREX-1 system adenine-specific DNA-methyltransferase PglX [Paenibacillus vietnamensis]MCA0757021.1 BREX-1 system adenine-specific DNA-methyltransferase PglX [Paenibacillus vietnamensis]